ncbi:hypothetical protein [Spirosoma endbachense]|uniref:Uncharacterized protein n=1 Tax=Spirosoma endbachense TaxID=2666025 RepID=A0A6P1VZA6_9BACT|nr:hypothetical protein [Spirosoma endbachense]QHV97964.1 hypothetical protein GJR95_24440 [Spirosoma endbachense]
MTLSVPVKPHIKEFFQSAEMFGPEPIEIRRNSRLGELVAAVFSQYPLRAEDLEDLEAVELLVPDRLNLKLKFELQTRLVTDGKLLQFGKVLETFFELYSIAFVKGRMDVYPTMNGAADRFVKVHQISDEHYSADAIRKMVQRSRSASDPFFTKLSVSEKRNVVQLSANPVQKAA